MSNISEFIKGEKSFYQYTKQTILHLLYKTFVTSAIISLLILLAYTFSSESKSHPILCALYIFGTITILILVLIIVVHVYYIFIKKDISPLQSENHQIAKEILSKVKGDSVSGMKTIDAIKSMYGINGENQNG